MARFTRAHRLLTPADYRRVFQEGIRSADGNLVVLGRSNGLDHSRLGLAISKKHVKGAVARNRIKRVIRESFRHAETGLGAIDLVVLSRVGLDAISNERLFIILNDHWIKLAERCAD